MGCSELYSLIMVALIAFVFLFSITLLLSIYLWYKFYCAKKISSQTDQSVNTSQPIMLLEGSDCTFIKERKKTKIVELVFNGLTKNEKPTLLLQQDNKIVFEVLANVDAELNVSEKLELILKK